MSTGAQEPNVAPIAEAGDVKTDGTNTTVTPVETKAENSNALTDQTRYLPRRQIISVLTVLRPYCLSDLTADLSRNRDYWSY